MCNDTGLINIPGGLACAEAPGGVVRCSCLAGGRKDDLSGCVGIFIALAIGLPLALVIIALAFT